MSIANSAAQYMLADALLPEGGNDSRLKSLVLELPIDRVIKFVSVGLPLLLVSMAFAREISTGPQISCFAPQNFTAKQAAYVDTYCWDSLMHHEFDTKGNFEERSLWVHKMFPYSLLVMAVMMYLPAMLWRFLVMPCLGADLLFVMDELDKSYNRSVRMAQSIVELQQNSRNSKTFAAELERAKRERYFEFPLLERYLQLKQCSYFLVSMLFLRSFLLLLFISAACLYLVYFHLSAFLQDEFSCFVKTGLLQEDPWVPELVQCKLTGLLVFQIISVTNGAIYLLLVPLILFGLLRLFCWDRRFLSVYEVLPALGLMGGQKLGCPLNDLNVILLFLRANVSQIRSYGRLRAVCSVSGSQGISLARGYKLENEEEKEEREEREEEAREEAEEKGYTLVDIMRVLAGSNRDKKAEINPEEMPPPETLGTGLCIFIYIFKRIIVIGIFILIIWDVQKIIK
ncbi:PANX3 protein, partial [Polypterus senegalus]